MRPILPHKRLALPMSHSIFKPLHLIVEALPAVWDIVRICAATTRKLIEAVLIQRIRFL